MKKFLLILAVILMSLPRAEGQSFVPTPVTVSKEKVNVNGKIFIQHNALKGQTLFSIGKAYGISVEDILENNPRLRSGLKAGDIIYIPMTAQAEEKATRKTEEKAAKKEERQEAVQQPSPLPEKTGDRQIQEKEKTLVTDSDVDRRAAKKRYRKYRVKWYDSLDDVAARFGVSVEMICALNKIDRNAPIRKGDRLLIPDKDFVMVTDQIEAVNKPQPPVTVAKNETAADSKVFPPKQETVSPARPQRPDPAVQPSRPDNIVTGGNPLYENAERTHILSVVLPFNVKAGPDRMNYNRGMMDFYSGLLIALDDFNSKADHRYSLNVVDLSAYSSTADMLSSGVLDRSELVIGPVYPEEMKDVAAYCKDRRIAIVSPFDHKTISLVADNPFFFQYPIDVSVLNRKQVDTVFDRADSVHHIIVYEKGYRHSKGVENCFRAFKEKGIDADSLSYQILDGMGMKKRYTALMNRDTTIQNRVIVASNNEAFVSDALRNLNLVRSTTDARISVYGTHSWRSFEIIDVEYFHYLNAHISTQYYIDYSAPLSKAFVDRYNGLFNTAPSRFSFQGYDILTFFLEALERYGRAFPNHLDELEIKLLQSNISFHAESSDAGFINDAVRNLEYHPDWSISY